MDRKIASCGLDCSKCGAYIATNNNDDGLRKKTAAEWSEMFSATIEPKDINCMGCHSEILFGHCYECEIRNCSTEKAHENCSQCQDYSCSKLEDFFKAVPDAKETLDNLR